MVAFGKTMKKIAFSACLALVASSTDPVQVDAVRMLANDAPLLRAPTGGRAQTGGLLHSRLGGGQPDGPQPTNPNTNTRVARPANKDSWVSRNKGYVGVGVLVIGLIVATAFAIANGVKYDNTDEAKLLNAQTDYNTATEEYEAALNDLEAARTKLETAREGYGAVDPNETVATLTTAEETSIDSKGWAWTDPASSKGGVDTTPSSG